MFLDFICQLFCSCWALCWQKSTFTWGPFVRHNHSQAYWRLYWQFPRCRTIWSSKCVHLSLHPGYHRSIYHSTRMKGAELSLTKAINPSKKRYSCPKFNCLIFGFIYTVKRWSFQERAAQILPEKLIRQCWFEASFAYWEIFNKWWLESTH